MKSLTQHTHTRPYLSKPAITEELSAGKYFSAATINMQAHNLYPMTPRALRRMLRAGISHAQLVFGNLKRMDESRLKLARGLWFLLECGKNVTISALHRATGCHWYTIRKHIDIWGDFATSDSGFGALGVSISSDNSLAASLPFIEEAAVSQGQIDAGDQFQFSEKAFSKLTPPAIEKPSKWGRLKEWFNEWSEEPSWMSDWKRTKHREKVEPDPVPIKKEIGHKSDNEPWQWSEEPLTRAEANRLGLPYDEPEERRAILRHKPQRGDKDDPRYDRKAIDRSRVVQPKRKVFG